MRPYVGLLLARLFGRVYVANWLALRERYVKDVFLSHAHPDKQKVVLPFVGELEKRRISYWLDEGEIRWGDKIGASINDGLNRSRYVVVFLTDAFFGRNWTETELSAALSRENSEGRVVVLPIIVGDPKIILAAHPLLKDKSYVTWDLGVEQVANHLENRLFAVTARDLVVPVKDTGNTVTISPRVLVDFLEEIDGGHGYLIPARICEVLRECGFLADVQIGKGIVINGYFIPNGQGDWGLPGIRDLYVVRLLYKLITGNNVVRRHLGRGWNYRAIVRDMVAAMRELQDRPLPIPSVPANLQGRWIDSKTICLYWEPSQYAEHYVVLQGRTPDTQAMIEIASTGDYVQQIDCDQVKGNYFFAVRSVNRSGEELSTVISSNDFARGEEEWSRSLSRSNYDREKALQDGWEDLGW